MRYARLCIHDQFAPHVCTICGGTGYSSGTVTVLGVKNEPCSCGYGRCNGGEFLPEDAVVIEKENGEWPKWALDRIRYRGKAVEAMDALADLVAARPWKASQIAADQVGEPG